MDDMTKLFGEHDIILDNAIRVIKLLDEKTRREHEYILANSMIELYRTLILRLYKKLGYMASVNIEIVNLEK